MLLSSHRIFMRWLFFNMHIFETNKTIFMSLLNQNNKKGKGKDNKNSKAPGAAQNSKFISKTNSAGFVKKSTTTSASRGS